MTAVLHGLTRVFAHGRGFTEAVPVASPAAGADFTYEVGSRYVERPVALCFNLVTSAVVASRQVVVSIRDENSISLAKIPAGGTQAASLTRTYSYFDRMGQAQAVASNTFLAPLPGIFMLPGWEIDVAVSSIDVGDQISNVRLLLERFDTGPEGYPLGMLELTPEQATAERLGD